MTDRNVCPTSDDRQECLSYWLIAEALAIFNRVDEGLHHLSLYEVAIELVQFSQPEVVPVKVIVWSIVRIPAQITEVLHHDEGAPKLGLLEARFLADLAQHGSMRFRTIVHSINQRVALRLCEGH